MNAKILSRFYRKIDMHYGNDGCWLWTGARKENGYGIYRQGLAHRFAWELLNGPIPPGEGYHGTCVLHHCDNPPCVNPAHLFVGTQGDNIRDSVEKGRWVCGRRAKLNEEQVKEIKFLLSQGHTVRWIGKRYGVSHAAIGYIRKGNTWKHLGGGVTMIDPQLTLDKLTELERRLGKQRLAVELDVSYMTVYRWLTERTEPLQVCVNAIDRLYAELVGKERT